MSQLNSLDGRFFCGQFRCGDSPVGITYLEAGEAADTDVFAELCDFGGNNLSDGLRLVLDEGLIEKAKLFIELAELAFKHLLDDVRGLTGRGGLGTVDILLALKVAFSHVFFANIASLGRGNVHSYVAADSPKIRGAGDEGSFAVA